VAAREIKGKGCGRLGFKGVVGGLSVWRRRGGVDVTHSLAHSCLFAMPCLAWLID